MYVFFGTEAQRRRYIAANGHLVAGQAVMLASSPAAWAELTRCNERIHTVMSPDYQKRPGDEELRAYIADLNRVNC